MKTTHNRYTPYNNYTPYNKVQQTCGSSWRVVVVVVVVSLLVAGKNIVATSPWGVGDTGKTDYGLSLLKDKTG